MRLDKKNRLCGVWVLHITVLELAGGLLISNLVVSSELAVSRSEALRGLKGTYLNKIDKQHRVGEDRPLTLGDFRWPNHPSSCFLAVRRGKSGGLIVLESEVEE